MLVVHALVVPVIVSNIVAKLNTTTGNWSTGMIKCVPKDSVAVVILQTELPIVVEPVEMCKALGRFVVRQDGETVGGGFVNKVL